jgi:hypothetical protein
MANIVNWFVSNFVWIQIGSILISILLLVAIIRLIIKIDYFSDRREYGREIWKINELRSIKLKELWKKTLKLISQPNPDKWKLALVVVDDFFDDTLKAVGYLGSSEEDRLSKVEKEKISNVEEIKKIHLEIVKLKAEENSILEHEKAKEYLRAYRQAFRQLGYME